MSEYKWVVKLKDIAAKHSKTISQVAIGIGMSEPNLYKCFKRGSIEIKHLEKIAELFNVPINYFFDDTAGGNVATNIGNSNVAMAGQNFFRDSGGEKNNEASELKGRVEYLVKLLEEKDKLIAEKERLITMLLKEEKLR